VAPAQFLARAVHPAKAFSREQEVKPISAPPRVFVSGKKQIISTVNTAVGKTVGEALVQTFA